MSDFSTPPYSVGVPFEAPTSSKPSMKKKPYRPTYEEQLSIRYGARANGCGVYVCNATTGHFFKALCFCVDEATAKLIANALNNLPQIKENE